MLDRSTSKTIAIRGVLGLNGDVKFARNLTQPIVTMETRGKIWRLWAGSLTFSFVRICRKLFVNVLFSSELLKRKRSFSPVAHDWEGIVQISGKIELKSWSKHLPLQTGNPKMAVHSHQLQYFLNKVGLGSEMHQTNTLESGTDISYPNYERSAAVWAISFLIIRNRAEISFIDSSVSHELMPCTFHLLSFFFCFHFEK